jgi:hypothetical protein
MMSFWERLLGISDKDQVDGFGRLEHDIRLQLRELGHLAFDFGVSLQDADSGVCDLGQSELLA